MKRSSRVLIPALILGASLGLRADVSMIALTVKVVGKDGSPIPGAKVSIRRTNASWTKEQVTDSKGAFSVFGVPTAKDKVYEFTVSKEGYAETRDLVSMALKDATEGSILKTFTLYHPNEVPAQGSVPGAVVVPEDPAGKLDFDARAAFNDTAIPMVNAGKYAEAVPVLEKAYKDMNEALPQIKDQTQKDELQQSVLPLVEKTYGLTLFQAGKKEEALPFLEKVVVREPKNTNVLVALVQGYAAKKDKANEGKYQAQLDAISGPRPDMAYNKGVEAFNKGHMKEAKEHLNKALEIDPNYADAHYLLGMIEYGGNNMAGAKSHFRKYLELAPSGSHAGDVKDALAGM